MTDILDSKQSIVKSIYMVSALARSNIGDHEWKFDNAYTSKDKMQVQDEKHSIATGGFQTDIVSAFELRANTSDACQGSVIWPYGARE